MGLFLLESYNTMKLGLYFIQNKVFTKTRQGCFLSCFEPKLMVT
jgi:hypothetical protein